jgi:hypothetical protein
MGWTDSHLHQFVDAKFISPWREAKAENRRPIPAFPATSQLEPATWTGSRQLSPQVAAALLSKARAELTSQQAQIVDTLKRQCPGFAVMRKLVFSFRAILRGGKVTTLHRWMEEVRKTGIYSLVRFVRTLKTGPKRSGSGGERTMEQRPGRGTT